MPKIVDRVITKNNKTLVLCTSCKRWLEPDKFSTNGYRGGYYPYCKECRRAKLREYYKNRKEVLEFEKQNATRIYTKWEERHRELPDGSLEIQCVECKKWYPDSYFYYDERTQRYASYCRDCLNAKYRVAARRRKKMDKEALSWLYGDVLNDNRHNPHEYKGVYVLINPDLRRQI